MKYGNAKPEAINAALAEVVKAYAAVVSTNDLSRVEAKLRTELWAHPTKWTRDMLKEWEMAHLQIANTSHTQRLKGRDR